MADVELVIKIPEEIYEIVSGRETNVSQEALINARQLVALALLDNTPLPKGHGDLKDFDKIEWYGCDFEGKACERANGDCSVCNFGNCDAKQVRELPIIIKADKENYENDDYYKGAQEEC